MFLQSKVKRLTEMFLSNFETSENRYNEVTSPMSRYQGQLKVQHLLRKYDTDLSRLIFLVFAYVLLDNSQVSV